jgi:hypothetical protein
MAYLQLLVNTCADVAGEFGAAMGAGFTVLWLAVVALMMSGLLSAPADGDSAQVGTGLTAGTGNAPATRR